MFFIITGKYVSSADLEFGKYRFEKSILYKYMI